MSELSIQQIAALKRLSHLKVGALFMAMGTGKTYTAMQFIQSVKDVNCVVWICPCGTKDNLSTEINLRGGIENLHIVGIESISQSRRIYLEIHNLVVSHNTFIVLDESIKIKNIGSLRSKRCIELSRLCEYKLILNGTPVTKNILDVWAQMEFLSPKILKMSFSQFKNTFCEYVTTTQVKGGKKIVSEYVTGLHNVAYLYSLIKHYVYECSLEINTNRNYIDLAYIADESVKSDYAEIKKKFLCIENMYAMQNNVFMALTQSLQQSYSLCSNKVALLRYVLTQYLPQKTIIFCKYVNTYNFLQSEFKDVLVLTYGKDSFGLNLQDRNIIIYFDKTFDYGLREQSGGRIDRLGQLEKDCIYIDFTSDLPLCRLINKNIGKKQDLQGYFKDKDIQDVLNEL